MTDGLRVVLVGNEAGCFSYILANDEREAVDVAMRCWGGDEKDYDLYVIVLGPAPPALAGSSIVDELRVVDCEHLLIAWLLGIVEKSGEP